ncbi:hypothetical protein C8A05DRAFT_29787 [Staphylotrichum tortipilum]|uniref:Serine-rich protein n=1 Tax=Staphylotrichum tortipilum TaxID=2831512 RepID=A0AAN6MTG2_9PEZI|nr:hypothetical protein C8A05DRAFT_29787 [Staphylotrichum longicolle]
MSAPSARHGLATPVHERSSSQSTNPSINTTTSSKPGIRLVAYSPPRLDPENRAPSQASSRDNAGSRASTSRTTTASDSRRPSWRDEVTEGQPASQGSALPSPAAPSFPLARSRDERVSGVKPVASPSGADPAGPTVLPLRSPSENSADITGPHASEPRRSRPDERPSTASQRPRSQSRRNLRLAVHSNGTFSLVRDEPQSAISDSAAGSLTSPHPSSISRSPSAQDRPSIDTWSDRRSSTPLTGASTIVLDQSYSDLTPHSRPSSSSRASSSTHLPEDPAAASPWNYRLVGGLRKVPTTPDKGKQPVYSTSASSSETQLAPLPEAPARDSDSDDNIHGQETPTRTVVPKASFASVASTQTIETIAEEPNYKVYGPGFVAQESSDSLVFSSASPSNWELLAQSSSAPQLPTSSPATSHDGNENYVVHGAPSVSPSSSLVTVSRKPRPVYSRESLVVAPLRPARKKSYERFGYYKQRSRETLRSRTGSVQSLKSLSSIITTQDPAQVLLTTPGLLNLGASSNSNQRFPWSIPTRPGSSSSNSSPISLTPRPQAPMLPSQPHQWSSQLSTVISESEGGSDLGRSISPQSDGLSHHHRRSSTGWMSSMHSRQMASMSSSLGGQLDEIVTSSASDSLERPEPSYARAGPSQVRMVRDQDEHGDGLADLDHRPSKTGLSAIFANGASRNLHSSGSRANSFTSSIPAWARVYYGSGERRFLGRRPSFITISDGDDSRPSSSAGFPGSESPNTDNFPQAIFSPRKRAREVQPGMAQPPAPGRASMEISTAPSQRQDNRVFRTLKQKSSSIWSPHLQTDRRATKYSAWDPPSVSWSADSGIMGKRNAQVVLFILGFIFPFAWMVAAFLPIPHNPTLDKSEADNGESRFESNHPAYRYQQHIDETRYESARWWRNLNRGMSIVGLLIIGAVIALAVIGVRQGWGQ